MKKYHVMCVIIAFLLTGCSTLKPERYVVDNVFTSTYPKIHIEVSQDFEYLSSTSQTGDRQGIEITLHGSSYYYPFIIAENKRIKKAIIIQLHKTSGYYIKDFFRNFEKKALEYGEEQLNGNNYKFYTTTVTPSAKFPLAKYLMDRGYVWPAGLYKTYGRISPQNNKYLEYISFFEAIEDTGLSLAAWKYKGSLSFEQRKYLQDFGRRFKDCVAVHGGKVLKSALESSQETLKPEVRYIEIKTDDTVYEYGEPKFKVHPGDTLQILRTKTCRGGVGICYKVKNVDTGEIGYVVEKRMTALHNIYSSKD